MRLFLSFIVAGFFFITPLQGNAADTGTHRLTTAGKQLPQASLLTELSSLELAAIVSPSSHDNGSVARCKPFSATNFINTVCFTSNNIISADEKYFVPLYPAHKPIALKLIFPEHYFW